ncbi:glycine-rich protein 5 [Ziziphus jujuba]|uniref:Glycine-rich protein 5 n=1 Tax=Ziziphus jujuba TaxID=326968 RepID=A0ABM3I6M3_ZIZJJ|nr:glycine-rich protein 5 [Ziziphus jujuba]
MAQRRSSFMGLLVFLFCFSISLSNAQRMFLDSYQKRALQDSHSNGMVGQNNVRVNWVGGQGTGSGSGSGNGVGSGSGTGTGSGFGSGGQGSTGYGSGTGTGRGYGSGSGNGNGNGYGSGSGSGSGTGSGFGEPGCGTYPVPGYPNPGQNPYYGCGCQPDPCSQIGYVQGNMPTNNNNNMGKKTSNEHSKVKPPPPKYGGGQESVPPPGNTMHEDSWYPPPRPQRIQALEYEIPPGKVKVDGFNPQDDDDEPPIKEKIDGSNTQEIQAQGSTQQRHH